MILDRWEAQGRPSDGWMFPAGSVSGHVEESSGKIQHADALKKLRAAHAAHEQWMMSKGQGEWCDAISRESGLEPDYLKRHSAIVKAGLKSFEPYCLRHSALTRLAEAGCDAFTLARIAGHSSITITQRYCHPQADAIERAFGKLAGGHNSGHNAKLALSAAAEDDVATDSQ